MSFSKTSVKPQLSERLVSIDALRGFDMFWIIGGDALFNALARAGKWPIQPEVEDQLEHVHWEGFHFYDLIFPLFLFLVGAVLPFSLGKLQDHGESTSALYWRVFRRTALLLLLAMLYNGALQLRFSLWPVDFSQIRIAGVLQRIAICYCIAALIMMHTRVLGQVLIATGLLLVYWAILAFIPAPGGHAGDYSMKGSLAGYVDRHYLPGKIFEAYYGYGDNEGILSTIPAISTTLLGLLAGQWLRSP